MSRVLIMAGGTGGHVFPALAVAKVLQSRGVSIRWMGTARGIESRLVPEATIALDYISVQGLRGKGLLGWLMAPFKLLKAVYEAYQHIKSFAPQTVLGLGGFASGPGGVAARLHGIPLVIHEQNAIAGLTNRSLAPLAKKVLLGFANSIRSNKALWVGNPVREEIEQIAEPALRYQDETRPLKLLVLGGSLGATSLNRNVPAALGLLGADYQIDVTHQCGEKHLDDARNAYQKAAVPAEITAFISDMAQAYAEADLVICRAGALTVAEVAAAGVASILVPFPYAVDDHQTHNAQVLTNADAALLIQDQSLTAEWLANTIRSLDADRQTLRKMASRARQQAKTGSAQVIADHCMELING